MKEQCSVSVVIKALNEERRIDAAVNSALAAVRDVGGEVILADSCSGDRTVDIASRHPITIVQLANPDDRCCGAGPQMGYQHAHGEFIYILDGDMKMLPGFLTSAIKLMRENPDIAGVGGVVVEMNKDSLEYIARMERSAQHMQPGEVDRLDMGGLYRRSAVEQSGYFSDRNLHSYEEFDLAARLRAGGWRLWRLDIPSVQHHGHDTPPYQLLMRRWQTKYINGLGELLKAAWGKPHFLLVIFGVRELRLYISVFAWLLSLPFTALLTIKDAAILPLFLLLLTAPFVGMTLRKKSARKAFFSIVSWVYNVGGLVRGLLSSQVDPRTQLATIVIRRQSEANHN